MRDDIKKKYKLFFMCNGPYEEESSSFGSGFL